MPYDHQSIEPKWQKRWQEEGVFKASEQEEDERPRRYILDMFPYPSGAGLHVGHPEGYTATDIVARYWRMRGENVLHPMGWDAFGLPAENYAIKTGVHPAESTQTNIDTFRRQIQSIGFSYDWDRELSTADPDYYRWTQWFFLFLYKQGLAYRKKAKVNWCDSCKTVLANEQVIDGRCERCDSEVILKELKQWFFKVTQYADRLLDNLESIDWPDSIKTMQRNWIGRKEGFVIHNPVKDMDVVLDSFTTTLPWSFADTFIVVAPEHPVVQTLVSGTVHEKEVLAFVDRVKNEDTRDRLDDTREKEGVFTGRYCVDPFDGKELPIWVANYAIYEFGTGIVRASAHDTRDYAFAQKYEIPLVEVVERPEGSLMPANAHDDDGVLMHSGLFDGKNVQSVYDEFSAWAEKQGIGESRVTYRLRDWLISRQRYWGAPIPILYCDVCGEVPVPEDQLPVELPTDVDFKPTGESPLVYSQTFHKVTCPTCGATEGVRRESDTMDTFVCSSWYMFRFCDPKNRQQFADPAVLKKWMPVELYVGGAEHAVLHLMYSRFFTMVLHDAGLVDFDEPFTALRNQGIILAEDGRKMSKRWGNVINPDDVVEQFGADTLRCYEMFMGPIEDSKPWSTNGVRGVRRFLDKVWHLFERGILSEGDTPLETRQLLHQTLQKVQSDIESFTFNTSISAFMILVNHVQECPEDRVTREMIEVCSKMLSPFAPHLAEECWSIAGMDGMVATSLWPSADESMLVQKTVTIGFQVNGKTRGSVEVSPDATEDEVLEVVRIAPGYIQHVGEKLQKKVIYVPGRIVNIIV